MEVNSPRLLQDRHLQQNLFRLVFLHTPSHPRPKLHPQAGLSRPPTASSVPSLVSKALRFPTLSVSPWQRFSPAVSPPFTIPPSTGPEPSPSDRQPKAQASKTRYEQPLAAARHPHHRSVSISTGRAPAPASSLAVMDQKQQPPTGVPGPTGRRIHIAHRRSPSELTPLMSMFANPNSRCPLSSPLSRRRNGPVCCSLP